MTSFNRLHNVHNPHQGSEKKVLALCSAGLLRSPTVAWVLGNAPYNYNTRAAGVNTEYALIPVDDALIEWADEIVCVTAEIRADLEQFCENNLIDLTNKKIITLNIPDRYKRRDPKLVKAIEIQYEAQNSES